MAPPGAGPRVAAVLAAAAALFGPIRIASTWRIFTKIMNEGGDIASGRLVAASVAGIYFEGAKARLAGEPQPFGWIEALRPVARARRSIPIYHIGGAQP